MKTPPYLRGRFHRSVASRNGIGAYLSPEVSQSGTGKLVALRQLLLDDDVAAFHLDVITNRQIFENSRHHFTG